MVDESQSASPRVESLERALRAALPALDWKGLGLLRVEDVERPQGLIVSLDRVHAPQALLEGVTVRCAWPLRRYHGHLLVAVALDPTAHAPDTPSHDDVAEPEVRLEWFEEG